MFGHSNIKNNKMYSIQNILGPIFLYALNFFLQVVKIMTTV